MVCGRAFPLIPEGGRTEQTADPGPFRHCRLQLRCLASRDDKRARQVSQYLDIVPYDGTYVVEAGSALSSCALAGWARSRLADCRLGGQTPLWRTPQEFRGTRLGGIFLRFRVTDP